MTDPAKPKSPRRAAELLGHASTEQTMDVYHHSSPRQKRAAARALDQLVKQVT